MNTYEIKKNQQYITYIEKKRSQIKQAIYEGTLFMLGCMEKGKVPSYRAGSGEWGIWPSAEMAEFLLTTSALPISSYAYVEEIIDYILSKFDNDAGAWPATDRLKSFSAGTTGQCVHVLKLYYNDLLTQKRKNQITNVIKKAERYLIGRQTSEGFWLHEESQAVMDSGLNYGDFFYSFNSYQGLREFIGSIHANAEMAKRKAKAYFIKYADFICEEQTKEVSPTVYKKSVFVSNSSKIIQVLSDFNDEECITRIKKMHSIIDKYFDEISKDFGHTTVLVDKLPNTVPKNFHNNTPYDIFFALLNYTDGTDHIIKIVDWYLDHQDATDCWYLDGDRSSNQNSWTTCEGLLVLSASYKFLMKEFYLRELCKLELHENKCESCKFEREKECENCKIESNTNISKLQVKLKNVKKEDKILIRVSVGISILISTICLVLFIVLITTTEGINPTLEKFIDVILFSLAGNALFQAIILIVRKGFSKKDGRNY